MRDISTKTVENYNKRKGLKHMSTQKSEKEPSALSGLAVPLGFNLNRNRYPLQIPLASDTSRLLASFYEYHGMYWYSLKVGKFFSANSVPFISVANCISAFRAFLRESNFGFEDSEIAEKRLRCLHRVSSSKSLPKSSEV